MGSTRKPSNSSAAAIAPALRLFQQGRIDAARFECERVLQRFPGAPEALHLSGLIYRARGDLLSATQSIERAVAIDGTQPVYFVNVGLCYAAMGESDKALRAFAHAVELKPLLPQALFNLSVLQTQTGNFVEAERNYRRLIAHRPAHEAAWNNLGELLLRGERAAEAADCFRRALALRGDFAEARFNLGLALQQLNFGEEAARELADVVRLRPEMLEAHLELGRALVASARQRDALEVLCAARMRHTNSAALHNVIGMVMGQLGHAAEARAEWTRALQLDPHHGEAYYNLVLAGGAKPAQEYLARAEKWLSATEVSREDRILLHFAAGALAEEIGHYSLAFTHFERANTLKQVHYDAAVVEDRASAMIDVFGPEFFQERAQFGVSDEGPLFIVGMPRSGTTLAEQILSAHPEVHGAGELTLLNTVASSLTKLARTNTAYPKSVRYLSAEHVEKIGRDYLAFTRRKGGAAKQIVDKMPDNFWHLGLIRLALPKAKIVHCRRDAVDTCLSCYTTNFAGHLPYTCDLASLVHYYGQYQRVMTHWTNAWRDAIFDLEYEKLVDTPEITIKRLLEFCNLPWDEACLHPERNTRPIATASQFQARNPISRPSVNRSESYRQFIQPLLALREKR